MRPAPEQHPVGRRLGDDRLPHRQGGAGAQEGRQRQRGAGLGGHRRLDRRRRPPHPWRRRVVRVGERDVDGIEQGSRHLVGLGDEDDDGGHRPQPLRGGGDGGVVGAVVRDQEEWLGSGEDRPVGAVGSRSGEVGQVADFHDGKPTLGDHDGSGALGDLRGDGPDRRPRRAAALPGERGRVRRGRRPRSLRSRRRRPRRAGGVRWARPAGSHLLRGRVPPPAVERRVGRADAQPARGRGRTARGVRGRRRGVGVGRSALGVGRCARRRTGRRPRSSSARCCSAFPSPRSARRSTPFAANGTARVPGGRNATGPLVVDLSALWAGPLAAACLAATGADVVKVEDVRRPDGARRGDPDFFDLLNGAKRSVALDLRDAAGRRQLGDLVARADVVVTSGRARAIAGLGLDPDAFLAGASDRVWVAITGHGWSSDRVGFGDDAAVAGGLVAWHPEDGEPRFAADAVADPLCGALAARAALDAWSVGGRWFVDASLAGAAASVAASGPAEAARGERADAGRSTASRSAPPVARRAPGPGSGAGRRHRGGARRAGRMTGLVLRRASIRPGAVVDVAVRDGLVVEPPSRRAARRMGRRRPRRPAAAARPGRPPHPPDGDRCRPDVGGLLARGDRRARQPRRGVASRPAAPARRLAPRRRLRRRHVRRARPAGARRRRRGAGADPGPHRHPVDARQRRTRRRPPGRPGRLARLASSATGPASPPACWCASTAGCAPGFPMPPVDLAPLGAWLAERGVTAVTDAGAGNGPSELAALAAARSAAAGDGDDRPRPTRSRPTASGSGR